MQALQLLANGWTYLEIAEEMGVGHSAVSMALLRVKTRLEAGTTAHAVALALRAGLIT